MLSKFILIVLILINVKALADEVPLNNIVANYALFYKNIDAKCDLKFNLIIIIKLLRVI